MITIIVPKLGLRLKTDTEFELYANDRVHDVPLVFGTTTPTILFVTGLVTAYHTALLNWRRGIKATTEAKKTARRDLHVALTDLAYDCANQAGQNVAQYLLTGFDMRNRSGVSPRLAAPENFKLTAGDVNELFANFKKIENNHGYEVMLSTNPVFAPGEPQWIFVGSNTKIFIPEQVSGQRYFGRVRAIGARNIPGYWSDISTIICP